MSALNERTQGLCQIPGWSVYLAGQFGGEKKRNWLVNIVCSSGDIESLWKDSLSSDSVILQTFVGYLLCLNTLSRHWGCNVTGQMCLWSSWNLQTCDWAHASQMKHRALQNSFTVLSQDVCPATGIFNKRNSKILKIPNYFSEWTMYHSTPKNVIGFLCGGSETPLASQSHLDTFRTGEVRQGSYRQLGRPPKGSSQGQQA